LPATRPRRPTVIMAAPRWPGSRPRRRPSGSASSRRSPTTPATRPAPRALSVCLVAPSSPASIATACTGRASSAATVSRAHPGLGRLRLEQALDLLARAEEPRADGARGDPELLADVAVGALLREVQLQHGAEPRLELVERVSQLRGVHAFPLVRRLRLGRGEVIEIDRFVRQLVRAAAVAVDEEVVHDAEEPELHVRAGLELVEA